MSLSTVSLDILVLNSLKIELLVVKVDSGEIIER